MITFLTWIILAVALGYFANEAEGVVLVGALQLHFQSASMFYYPFDFEE